MGTVECDPWRLHREPQRLIRTFCPKRSDPTSSRYQRPFSVLRKSMSDSIMGRCYVRDGQRANQFPILDGSTFNSMEE
jgi:hypothetical protein